MKSTAISLLLMLAAVLPAMGQNADTWQEIPGRIEFSGQMIARPVQPDVWQERGLTAAEAAQRNRQAATILASYDIIEYVPETDETIFAVPAGRHEREVADELTAGGLFQYVQPDWRVWPVSCPNDPHLEDQLHHRADLMQSCDGWDIHTGNPSVVVGIVDTGLRITHEDLQLHRYEGYNSISNLWESQGGDISPFDPHGTLTTGAACANGNNGLGISGVGWNLGHRMLRPTDEGGATLSNLQECARVSIQAGDKVASVSWWGVDYESCRTTATYIKSIGGLLFWAAGNDGRYLSVNDRDADDLIVVGGTDPNDGAYVDSAWGPYIDFAALAVDVYTTGGDHDAHYMYIGGTSLATPLAAGLAALIWSAYPGLAPNTVEAMLKVGCEDVGSPGIDSRFGYGRINVYRSLMLNGAIHVDFSHVGFEFGTFWWPYDTFVEGYNATPTGGVMAIKAGTTGETPSITRAMTIFAYGGMVTIGQ